LPAGTIIRGIGGFYYVASEDGSIVECKARGIFRKNKITPLTGDRVIFSMIDPARKKGSIDKIEERSTVLLRPAVANVNQMVAVIAAKSPEPDLMLVDKLLVTAEKKGIRVIVCINKTDLDEQDKIAILGRPYTIAGYDVIETNKQETDGFNELKSLLKGYVTVFAGQSGVGKSTLLNRIMNTLVMKTGELSDRLDRGKHTTRQVELLRLEEGGFVVDTPGFSSFELSGIDCQELQYLFPEFKDHIQHCRFKGCSHISEPDCGVKRAVDDKRIDCGRYDRYVELHALLKLEEESKYR
jgi:ribosome biogenesis GTPase